jgi:hypothetical protein
MSKGTHSYMSSMIRVIKTYSVSDPGFYYVIRMCVCIYIYIYVTEDSRRIPRVTVSVVLILLISHLHFMLVTLV